MAAPPAARALEAEAFARAAACAAAGAFATADAVLAALGGIYAVQGAMARAPEYYYTPGAQPAGGAMPRCVAHLCDVQRRLDAVVACFFVTRPVACLADLEEEAARALRAACVPSLQEARDAVLPGGPRDSAEIDLEDDNPATDRYPSFEAFGLGPLASFPAVAARFSRRPRRRVSQDLVLRELRAFNGPSADFPAHLARALEVRDLVADSGVFLDVNALAPLRAHLAEHLPAPVPAATSPAAPIAKPAPSRGFGKVPKLRRPQGNPVAARFVDSVHEAMEAADMRFSPSFAKLQALIQERLPLSSKTALHVAVEYALLHVGSARHRAKRFEQSEDVDGDESGGSANPGEPESAPGCPDAMKSACPASKDDVTNNVANHGTHGETNEMKNGVRNNETRIASKDTTGADDATSSVINHTRAPAAKGDGSRSQRSLSGAGTADMLSPIARKRPRFEASMPHHRGNPHIRWIHNPDLASVLPSLAALDTRDGRKVGRWGESLVYHYLAAQHPDWNVEWMNENKESLASFDLKMTERKTNSLRTTRFIEVKTSRYADKNAFEISLNEWDFFAGQRSASINFEIFRVFCAGDPNNVRIAVIKDPLRLLREQRINLCLAI